MPLRGANYLYTDNEIPEEFRRYVFQTLDGLAGALAGTWQFYRHMTGGSTEAGYVISQAGYNLEITGHRSVSFAASPVFNKYNVPGPAFHGTIAGFSLRDVIGARFSPVSYHHGAHPAEREEGVITHVDYNDCVVFDPMVPYELELRLYLECPPATSGTLGGQIGPGSCPSSYPWFTLGVPPDEQYSWEGLRIKLRHHRDYYIAENAYHGMVSLARYAQGRAVLYRGYYTTLGHFTHDRLARLAALLIAVLKSPRISYDFARLWDEWWIARSDEDHPYLHGKKMYPYCHGYRGPSTVTEPPYPARLDAQTGIIAVGTECFRENGSPYCIELEDPLESEDRLRHFITSLLHGRYSEYRETARITSLRETEEWKLYTRIARHTARYLKRLYAIYGYEAKEDPFTGPGGNPQARAMRIQLLAVRGYAPWDPVGRTYYKPLPGGGLLLVDELGVRHTITERAMRFYMEHRDVFRDPVEAQAWLKYYYPQTPLALSYFASVRRVGLSALLDHRLLPDVEDDPEEYWAEYY